MRTAKTDQTSPPRWTKIVAILALIFGALTLFSGASVLFGPEQARAAAGNFLPFVVWFNFLAGFAYVTAAIGIWQYEGWAVALSGLIAVATGFTALAFGMYQVFQGVPYEMRTIGALTLRFCVWVAITSALLWSRRA